MAGVQAVYNGGVSEIVELPFTLATTIDKNSVEAISIFPNPAINNISIANVEKADVYIYNVSGKLVKYDQIGDK